jgi:hypothetical protein
MQATTGFLRSIPATVTKRFNDLEPLQQNRGVRYAIYALCLGIVIAVVVMLADLFFPFLPINPISGPSAAARAGKLFWTSQNDENLVVPDPPTTSATNYTMSVQLMIGDSRTPSQGKFRHILHRGSNPCGLTNATAGPTGHAGVQISDIPADADPTYKELGLPAIMNPGLFLDKYKNDVHVFVHTRGKEGGMEVLWLESLTLEDLPLATPISIGVVCNGRSLEVYVNCRLYSTLFLKGKPYLPKADNTWFGRYCAYPVSGIVKDLKLWDTALNSTDYMLMCRGASFNKVDLPAACPTADKSAPTGRDGQSTPGLRSSK